MNPLKILLTILLMLGTTGCATYLYTAHIPVAAYNFAQGFDNNTGPDVSNPNINPNVRPEIRVASLDDAAGLPEKTDNRHIFEDMRSATSSFQRLLKAKKVDNADDYVLTRVDRKEDSEFILIAAVYRPQQLVDVAEDDFSGTRNVISDKSPAFYEPYRTDYGGSVLDKVVAWSLVPVSCLNGPEQQSAVLNETAGAVIDKSTQAEFWAARDQWANDGDAGILMLAGNLMSCPAPGSVQG
jgi:hypothetical protein